MQDSTTQSFTISLSNTNPSCTPLPTVCIYIGQYFLVDMDKYCSDPEGQDITLTANITTNAYGVTYNPITNEIFGTPTAIWAGGATDLVAF